MEPNTYKMISFSITIRKNEIGKYSLFYFLHDFKLDIHKILENFKKSKIILISQYNEAKFNYYAISFSETIIIIKKSLLNQLKNLFSSHTNLNICFSSKSIALNLKNYIDISYNESYYDDFFIEEIDSLKDHIAIKNSSDSDFQINTEIKSCISGYLIKESYAQTYENELDINDQNVSRSNKIFKENDYIELRLLGIGSIFKTYLIYLIPHKKLCVIKKPNIITTETEKLMKREYNNYLKLKCQFLPKFYGIVQNTNYLIIEFINGKDLDNIKSINDDDAINIVFHLLLILYYFYMNDFIYRDLKPNNVIINQKNILLPD